MRDDWRRRLAAWPDRRHPRVIVTGAIVVMVALSGAGAKYALTRDAHQVRQPAVTVTSTSPGGARGQGGAKSSPAAVTRTAGTPAATRQVPPPTFPGTATPLHASSSPAATWTSAPVTTPATTPATSAPVTTAPVTTAPVTTPATTPATSAPVTTAPVTTPAVPPAAS